MVAIILAILPYCTPQDNPVILTACIDYFVQCVDGDLENNEEPCAEQIDPELVP